MANTSFVLVGAQQIEFVRLRSGRPDADGVVSVEISPTSPMNSESPPVSAALQRLSVLVDIEGSREQPEQRPKHRLCVVIADCWLASATLPWSDALRSATGAELYAGLFLMAAGHRPTPGDRVVIDDAPAGQPRLVISYPGSVLAALQSFADDQGAELTSLVPLSAVAWSQAAHRATIDSLAVLADNLILVGFGRGRLSGVVVRAYENFASDDGCTALAEQWRRMQLRDSELATVPKLRVLDVRSQAVAPQERPADTLSFQNVVGPADSAVSRLPRSLQLASAAVDGVSALDGAHRRRPMSAMQRSVALIALVVACTATLQAWHVGQQTGSVLREAATAASLEKLPRAPTFGKGQLPRIRAVNVAISDLNMPVLDLLSRLVPPRDLPVSIVSVDVPAPVQRGEDIRRSVKIVAEAEDAIDMTRYVSFINERKSLDSAYLLAHEVVAADAKLPYRFTVEALWAP